MSVNINQARVLCTATEFTLYEASRPDRIKQHSPADIKRKVQRARILRSKYQDLYKRQRLQTRARTGTKRGDRPERNVRTAQKAKLFAEVLERFQKQEARQQAAARQAATRQKAAEVKARVRSKASAEAQGSPRTTASPKTMAKTQPKAKSRARSSGYVSQAAASANQRRQLSKTRGKAVAGHTRAVGKRSQARRDARR
jgi:hypothetical protein